MNNHPELFFYHYFNIVLELNEIALVLCYLWQEEQLGVYQGDVLFQVIFRIAIFIPLITLHICFIFCIFEFEKE